MKLPRDEAWEPEVVPRISFPRMKWLWFMALVLGAGGGRTGSLGRAAGRAHHPESGEVK
jgi:hypothetical protein